MWLALAALLLSASFLAAPAPARAGTLPDGFQETTAFSGLTNPTAMQFSPDGRVFVAEKSGLVKVFDGLADNSPTTFADLRTNVHNFWDRGLLGLALSPNFPSDPYVYALYTHDAPIGGTAPRWGSPGATSDGCPNPPGATSAGCVVSGRLSRLRADGNSMTGSEQVLIEDWCQQFPSHSVGDIAFGPDGALYVSGGEGASFSFVDYGQSGEPLNPCGDPPAGVGGTQVPPGAEGGALRAQDLRTQGSLTAATYNLRPNSDVTSEWVLGGGATSAWDALDDDVIQPSEVPVEQFIYEGVQDKVAEVGLTTQQLGGAAPTSGKAWFYGNVAPNSAVRVDVVWGGAVHASTTVSGGASGAPYAWRSIDVTPPSQAAVDDLRLRFTIAAGSGSGSNMFASYFELRTGEPGSVADPTGLNGALLRVDPATGAGLPDNPLASSADPNARRIVAYGMRNPFRFALRPGTGEIWIGDVGWNEWEEIDRIVAPTSAPADNFGWPCYEGSSRQSGYDAADLSLCEGLYGQIGAVSPPLYAYRPVDQVVSGESCPTGSSSLAGSAFYTSGPYPPEYDSAFLFADYSRDCIWVMKSNGGTPDPSRIVTLDAGAANPVDLVMGPDGAVYYVDFDGGTIRKIAYTAANQSPTAVASANPTSGAVPLSVQFDGTGSRDPDAGDTLSYAWDLDADGQYDDSTATQPTWTYSAAGTYDVGLKVTDQAGASGTDLVTIRAGNAPQADIATPADGSLWRVGEQISFSGSATDAEDGTLPASAYSWQLNLEHCPSNCHTHPLQTFSGVTSGSFAAPDHDYPSHLTLALTVTDSTGLSDTDQIRLDPRTVAITLASNPSGLSLTLDGATAAAPFTRTVILGSTNTISAPSPQRRRGKTYSFSSWSDGGAQTHNITANGNAGYTATYVVKK